MLFNFNFNFFFNGDEDDNGFVGEAKTNGTEYCLNPGVLRKSLLLLLLLLLLFDNNDDDNSVVDRLLLFVLDGINSVFLRFIFCGLNSNLRLN